MKIIGYCDPLTVSPGETVRFRVSCEAARYRADIVRLIHGDTNPKGPGLREVPLSTPADGDYPGRRQSIRPGSYARVADAPALSPADAMTLSAWIRPTTPDKGEQTLIAKWADGDGPGYGFGLTAEGGVTLTLRGADGAEASLAAGAALRPGEWYLVAATYDTETGRATIHQWPRCNWPDDVSRASARGTLSPGLLVRHDGPLTMAARPATGGGDGEHMTTHYNGKIEAPAIHDVALDDDAIAALHADRDPRLPAVAAWDFSRGIDSDRIMAVEGEGCDGRVHQMPARAMTGHLWNGHVDDFRQCPAHYGAIHFHDDDLEDAGWAVDFEYRVPADLPSGIYAARLRPDGNIEGEDHVPFFVLPAADAARAPVAFLAPICSYQAYGNEQLEEVPMALCPNQNPEASRDAYDYAAQQRLLSLYERHADGSGVCYASRLRPIVNLKPRFRMMATDGPHQFGADLHLVDWLEHKGFAHDVLTDEALEAEGADLLRPYRVILTGTHPEYWSHGMLQALQTYLADGGRLMYLGGNGFYWVTSFDSARPHVVEIRRSDGIRSWEAAPGERHHSTTGERGGLWRGRGWPPQALVGVGFTAQGFDINSPYRRQPASYDERAAFIFEGIEGERIGDCESLVLKYGAAGFELDRADTELGTPPNAHVLASSYAHSDAYQHSVEEVLMSDSRQGGTVEPRVRSDLVYFKYPNEGAVFSVGSIAWCGSLSARDYDSDVSRVTENVLRRFMDAGPLP